MILMGVGVDWTAAAAHCVGVGGGDGSLSVCGVFHSRRVYDDVLVERVCEWVVIGVSGLIGDIRIVKVWMRCVGCGCAGDDGLW